MGQAISNLFARLFELFFTKNLDICMVGLDNSGKTTLLNILAHGYPIETVPTVSNRRLDILTLIINVLTRAFVNSLAKTYSK